MLNFLPPRPCRSCLTISFPYVCLQYFSNSSSANTPSFSMKYKSFSLEQINRLANRYLLMDLPVKFLLKQFVSQLVDHVVVKFLLVFGNTGSEDARFQRTRPRRLFVNFTSVGNKFCNKDNFELPGSLNWMCSQSCKLWTSPVSPSTNNKKQPSWVMRR